MPQADPVLRRSWTVGEVLGAIPELRFDLVEHLLGTKQAPWLEARLAQYRAYLAGDRPASDHRQAIVAAVRQSLARLAPAYAGLPGITAFRDIPLIDREMVRTDPASFISCEVDPAAVWTMTTSGTTGPPLKITYAAPVYFEFLSLSVRKSIQPVAPPSFASDRVFAVTLDSRSDLPEFVTADPTGAVRLLVDEADRDSITRAFRLRRLLEPAVIVSRPRLFELKIPALPSGKSGRRSPFR